MQRQILLYCCRFEDMKKQMMSQPAAVGSSGCDQSVSRCSSRVRLHEALQYASTLSQ